MGAGFDAGSQVGCPTLVPTTLVDENTLTGEIPEGLSGAGGTSQQIAVYVMNADGGTSTVQMFTVEFLAVTLQSWTTIAAVSKEVPGFQWGGQIGKDDVQRWIGSVAQEIAGAMLKRGLPLDPALWPKPDTAGSPSPTGVLETMNRLGAAARLAAAIAANFVTTGQWAVQGSLDKAYLRQLGEMQGGSYDKLFLASAATEEAGPLLAAGDLSRADGSSSGFFRKEQVF